MKFISPPLVYRLLFPYLIWNIPNKEKKIYLTFDDGPIPEVTPWVLEQLKIFNARATFFCIGENIKKNPGLYQNIIAAGHQTGNHTFNHLNGWKVSTSEYISNTERTWEYCDSALFRPPYGKIKFSQARQLKNKYKIIMWDVLSYDFDKETTPEQCLRNVIDFSSTGSIVVFHDSIKAEKNLKFALPQVLSFFSEKGFKFEAIL